MRAELWVIAGAMVAFVATLSFIFACVRPLQKTNKIKIKW
jgi:hypothetical protein